MEATEISTAIDNCKRHGSVLVVSIIDDDCNGMRDILTSEELKEKLSGHRCETVELCFGSPEYSQFAAKYPVTSIPSVFFISSTGLPLDIVHGSVTVKQLVARLDKAIETNTTGGGTSPLIGQNRSVPSPKSNQTTAHDLQVNRRKVQQDQSKVKKLQDATPTTRSTDAGVVHRTVPQKGAQQNSSSLPLTSSSGRCKLQLKMVNSGEKLIQQFGSRDTLSAVKLFLSKELNLPMDSFLLERGYPVCKFTPEDDLKSLEELQLTPSALILVTKKVPPGSMTVFAKGWNFLVQLLLSIVWPFQQLISYFIGGTDSNSRTSRHSGGTNRYQQSRSRKETGNVRSLRQDGDGADDDQNTYNGNSTQQQ